MPLCFYGCNKESKYQLKNGKFCCESNPAKCEIIKEKQRERIRTKGHSKGFSGKTPWNKGLKGDPRCKSNKGQYGYWNGKHHSEETKKLMREKILIRYENGWMPKAGRCKKINYNSPIAGEVLVDGNWELLLCKYLDFLNLTWYRNKKRFPYKHLSGKDSNYTPDFYVKEWNSFVEIKGYETELDKCKWSQFKEPLKIIKYLEMKDIKKILVENNIIPRSFNL